MIQFDRLKKLADHLLYGELEHKEFKFSVFNSLSDYYDNEVFKENGCGTMGCAIGECPKVFPEDWVFKMDDDLSWNPMLINIPVGTNDVINSIMQFFGLTEQESKVLFYPSPFTYYTTRHEYLKFLFGNATKEQVANNILLFIEHESNKVI